MKWRGAAAACCLGAASSFAPLATAADPAALIDQVRATALDPQHAVTLSGVDVELGLATLHVDQGTLVPARTADGRTVELVLLGDARFRLEPPDEIEAGQVELFTGRRTVDATLDAAVLVLFDEAAQARLLDHPRAVIHGRTLARAEEVHRAWLERTERRSSGIESGIFRALLGDGAYRGYFALWCRSRELGDFVYQVDPEDVEPLTLARFHPVDVHGWDRQRLAHHIKLQQRKGRFLGVRLEDLGAWDVWMSTGWPGAQLPGHRGFEPEHYTLDVTIQRKRMQLQGKARIDLRVETGGRRTLTLDLFRDLHVDRVTDARGRALFAFRSGGDVVVVLPEPSVAGEHTTLEVEFGGNALEWVGPGTFDLLDTGEWYPHAGTIDRATYDVTLRWPRNYDLVSGGHVIASGADESYRWEQRRLDQPAIACSFAVGDLRLERRRVGHVEVTVAFTRARPIRLTDAVRREMFDTVADALAHFERVFGPYPLDELSAVALPRRYSQSYLGFVTLSDHIVPTAAEAEQDDPAWLRETTVAHEIAHQWWGNRVGWYSYRDRWLGEAVASYAALLYFAQAHSGGRSFLAEMSAGWRDSLGRTTAEGRTIESLGPVVLGDRLNSSLSGTAYQAIVYRKGAAVLAMLARAVGEERFVEMLGSLAAAAGDHVLTTESFLKALERMSGLELEGFSRQFVYGTGIPQVYYDWEAQAGSGGGWVLSGEAHEAAAPRWRLAIGRTATGWDVTRRHELERSTRSKALMVPFVMDLEPTAASVAAADGEARNGVVREGRFFLDAPRGEFTLQTDTRPVALALDPYGELLARFYSVRRQPKRVLRLRASDRELAGDSEGAERLYLDVLRTAAPAPTEASASPGELRDLRRPLPQDDAAARLALARIYLERGKGAEAKAQLDAAEALLEDSTLYRVEREVLQARVELAAGSAAAAHQRLRKLLRTATLRDIGWRSVFARLQLGADGAAAAEAFAVLAIAAQRVGSLEDASWALQQARERHVDTTEFAASVGAGR
ncbi:MAG TPA: M1 family aminopeptidase [Candidatus Polarisedimenticolaceae bacterium]|nr:M1 family aminopeptidase [Candidatus Polarisedimenticolaceae bacterium]